MVPTVLAVRALKVGVSGAVGCASSHEISQPVGDDLLDVLDVVVELVVVAAGDHQGTAGRMRHRTYPCLQVALESGLVKFQDIDWQATALATAAATGKNTVQGRKDVLDGFDNFARNMVTDNTVSHVLRDHLFILQKIRTQSASLGSLAACRALG